ncbi:hypothetical protein [Methylobacterium sp. CM6257]
MNKIALVSATALTALAIAAPGAQARPLGEAAAVGAGVAGFAAGTALGAAATDGYVGDYGYGYGGYGYDVGYPAYSGYSWGGPTFAGYAWEPAGYAYPATEEVDTTIVTQPRTVSRTVVNAGYAPAYRAGYGYESRTIRRGYERPVARRAYGETYGYRTVSNRGYDVGYRQSIRTRSAADRTFAYEHGHRGREGFRSASFRTEGLNHGFRARNGIEATGARTNMRSTERGYRNVSARGSDTLDRGASVQRGTGMARDGELGRGMQGSRFGGRASQRGLE